MARWFRSPLGKRFTRLLIVLLTLQGWPLPEVSRSSHGLWPAFVQKLLTTAHNWWGHELAEALPNAARIFTIAPSCAGPGDVVTITGNGFGADNMLIYVGGHETSPGVITNGIPAQILSAVGNRATFLVPPGVASGVTVVWAINPGNRAGSIAFRLWGPEICGDNTVDEDCDGEINDPDVCTPVNHLPVANAGSDQTQLVGSTIVLDGTASSDPDGDTLTFSWVLSSKPQGSTATLSSATTATPTFVLDTPGNYTIHLTVSDGFLSSTDTVIISTVNSAPVANAGPDTSGQVDTTVTLDGSGSSDVDGDGLTYQWTLLSRPSGSNATLSEPNSVTPSFTIDAFGDYVAQLIVHDGTVSSAPDTVTISTLNSPPVANAGADQSAHVTETVILDGSGSSDAEGNTLAYYWSLVSRPTGSTASLVDVTATTPRLTIDVPGSYVVQLVVNDGIASSAPDTVTITTLNSKPVAEAGTDQSNTVGTEIRLDGSLSTDVDGDSLSYFWALTTKPESSATALSSSTQVTPSFTPDVAGTYVAQLIVNDGTVDSDPDTVTITVTEPDTTPPLPADVGKITVSAPSGGSSTISGAAGSVEAGAQVQITNARTNQSVTVTANADGSFTTQIGAQAGDTLQIVVTDLAGNRSIPRTTQVEPAVPPDPATVAPPVDRTIATTVVDSTAFLYTGLDPIQTGIAPGTIEAKRAALVRGAVVQRDGTPLPGVTISVLSHSELGQTLSRADGRFDLVVNGGGALTFVYQKPGYLPAQRTVDLSWQETVTLPDVALIVRDSQVSTIDLTATIPIQVARGSVMTDSDGTRQATLFFSQGTQAQMLLADGTTQPLTTLHVRATEYTVGDRGEQSMPAPLPPTSAYTYAVELSVDEAVAGGHKFAGKDVLFSQPVVFYVENFLGLPIGKAVPVGYYNNDAAAWVPWDNGKIIKILRISGGLAELDTDGDTVVDSATTLNGLGITEAEQQQLASVYTEGQSLWRTSLTHFSTWDCNFNAGPDGGGSPDAGDPEGEEGGDGGSGSGDDGDGTPEDGIGDQSADPDASSDGTGGGDSTVGIGDSTVHCGSTLECENQVLGEALLLTGTGMRLHYSSDRVPGRTSAYALKIPLTHSSLPAGLRRVEVEVWVAGRYYQRSFSPLPSRSTRFSWNGKDVYDRTLQGRQPVRVTTTFVYGARYMDPGTLARAFAAYGQSSILTNRAGGVARAEFRFPRTWRGLIGPWQAEAAGLGAWTVGVHHAYDPSGQTLYLGDGGRRVARQLNPQINTVAGSSRNSGSPGDGGPATDAWLSSASGVVVDTKGNLYIADPSQHVVRKVDPAGVITRVAGTFPQAGTTPATQFTLNSPWGLALDGNDNLYVSDNVAHRVYKVTPLGGISTVAGTGVQGYNGDGGPAIGAQLNAPRAVAVDSHGALYIADTTNHRVRKVGPGGIITTVAGKGTTNLFAAVEGLRATDVDVPSPRGLAIDPAGNLFVVDGGHRVVWRVRPDGIINRYAGTLLSDGFAGDGGRATSAKIAVNAEGLALDRAGNLYIGDASNQRVRSVSRDGIITTVAGNGLQGFSGDGGTAGAATFATPTGVTIAPDGSLYVADLNNRRVRRIRSIFPNFSGIGNISIPSANGGELYRFDSRGRHLQTIDTLTGAVRYEFTYDGTGLVRQIRDVDGDVTTIERTGTGVPTAIIAPFGQRTILSLDANGYLTGATTPAGETTSFASTTGGLLTGMTTARGDTYTFTYNNRGRLLRDDDPAGGSQSFTRTTVPGGYEVTRTSGGNRTARYKVTRSSTGARQRLTTQPDGTQLQRTFATDGTRVISVPNGSVVGQSEGGDPRFGLQAPFATGFTVTTPGGLISTTNRSRSVTLSDPNNPVSLVTQIDTTTVNGRTYTTAYTQSTKTFTTHTPANRQASTTINTQGRITQMSVPGVAPLSRSYDAHGHLNSVGQGGRATTFTYDTNGYLTSATDSLARTVSYTRDAIGRLTSQTLPDGRVIQFTYDATGNITSITPPSSGTHGFSFTPIDLVQTYNPPVVTGGGAGVTHYTYDADRLLTRITRPDGQQITLTYDSAQRLSSQNLPTGSFGYTYEPDGRLKTATAPAGSSVTHSHDGGLLTASTWNGPISGNVSWTYNTNFRPITQSVNGSTPLTLTYDSDSLLTSAGPLVLTRDAQNGLLTGTTLGAVSDTISYNPLAEPSTYQATATGSNVFTQQYTRDNGGRLTQKTETIAGTTNTYSYTYDQAGRLVEVQQNGLTVSTYTYDANGNRLTHTVPAGTQTGSYDGQDRLLSYNGATYTYTANGELQSKAVGGQTTTYTYDALGNLLSVTLPNGTQLDYILDGQQRRVGKRVNGTLAQGFLYQNQLNPVAELDGSGNLVSRFVYASKGNVPDYLIKGGVTYRIISDHLGSPRLVIDSSDGSIVQQMDYDEFGNVITDTNPGFQPFGFAGGLYDRDTKLVRFGARDYDAETGRWTAKDPILFAGGDTNLYGYVLNDPVNGIDPAGLIFETVWDLANVAMDAASLGANVAAGNYGGAALDAVSLAADLAATAVPGLPGGAGVACRAARAGSDTLVIGRRADLAKPGAIGAGEYILSWPSKHPDSKAEWAENSKYLREAMANRRPIRDASPNDKKGFFLNAERNLLNNHGWKFDEATNFWFPPL